MPIMSVELRRATIRQLLTPSWQRYPKIASGREDARVGAMCDGKWGRDRGGQRRGNGSGMWGMKEESDVARSCRIFSRQYTEPTQW